MNHREAFTQSISRLRGYERLLEADERRSEELVRLIEQSKDENVTAQHRLKMAARRARERKRKRPGKSYGARTATFSPGTGWDGGSGI